MKNYNVEDCIVTFNGVPLEASTNNFHSYYPETIECTLENVTGESLDSIANQVGIIRQEESPEEVIHYCKHNDCGWCYYRGEGETNDMNGACNNPQTCKVNIDGE